jgi:hypothetical protein
LSLNWLNMKSSICLISVWFILFLRINILKISAWELNIMAFYCLKLIVLIHF